MRPVTATWEHPKWGVFEHDGVGWTGKVDAPAFRAFTWDSPWTRTRIGDRPQGAFKFVFQAEDETERPAAAMEAVADEVLAAQEKLVSKVTAALWDDFHGRGGKSGMWWHAGFDQIAQSFADEGVSRPKKARDLLQGMQLAAIVVRPCVHRYDRPIVELSFEAAFEIEHGVGVLTDGEKILGIGYAVDVTPFKERR